MKKSRIEIQRGNKLRTRGTAQFSFGVIVKKESQKIELAIYMFDKTKNYR